MCLIWLLAWVRVVSLAGMAYRKIIPGGRGVRIPLLLAVVAVDAQAGPAETSDRVEITTSPVAEGLYMLQGQGGNIGVFVGSDGTFMINDQYAPLTEKIIAAVGKITDQPIKFLLNTHWHSEHVGGNGNIAKTGAIIIAHDNVRERLLRGIEIEEPSRVVLPAPPAVLPAMTFSQNITLYWNGDRVGIEYVGPAHTDGDAVVYFEKANVVHTGDLYFNGTYPFIDAASGGSIVGLVEEVENILSRIDDNTRIIPGHGPLSNKSELEAYRQLLATVHTRIRSLKNMGKSLEAIIAAKPTADFDDKWGKGVLTPDQWVEVVYLSL